MPDSGHGRTRDLEPFTGAEAAFERVVALYEEAVQTVRGRVTAIVEGRSDAAEGPPACYPYVGITVPPGPGRPSQSGLSYGALHAAGSYGATITRPALFRSYYLKQFELLLENHAGPLMVGVSERPIPLTFVTEGLEAGLTAEQVEELPIRFPMPDLSRIDDAIANGTFAARPGEPKPLALFSAARVDYSLTRLRHYTATSPQHFQRFVFFTNYQRYVDEFVAYGKAQVGNGGDYRAFVEPGDVVAPNPRLSDEAPSGQAPRHLPQMPAYHLVRDRHQGITLINIGVGPSNAKTITDHVAVLRPHCWLMVGHCGGLRKTQRLGDYVLAHAYVRADHVLDEDLPVWVPVPPIAEVQIALTESVADVTGRAGRELKRRLRTGTVFTTDDRDWELRYNALALRFNQSRAIAVDMESATIAANGFRFRVPYGTLLCVSDKPLHGEIKLPAMANSFYNQSISQHLEIGLGAIERLRQQGVETLHSRKLRSFDEPAFR